MPVSVTERGALERMIDKFLKEAPSLLRTLRPKASVLQIREPNDYLLGFVVGVIVGSFSVAFESEEGRALNEEELSEVNDVAFRRTREIRKAMFKAG